MAKLYRLEDCGRCPNCVPEKLRCTLAKRTFTGRESVTWGIPDWCPLEDAPEKPGKETTHED